MSGYIKTHQAAFPLDHRCVHAIWALADRGDGDAGELAKGSIEVLHAVALDIADGIRADDFAQRVMAEAIASRLEEGSDV